MERRRDSRQASVKTHIHHRGGGCQISSMLNRWLASRCRGGRRGEIEVTLVWSPPGVERQMDLTLPGFVRRSLRIGVVCLSVKGQLRIVVKFEIKKR